MRYDTDSVLGRIRYDWRALAELQAALGDDWDTRISTAAGRMDTDTIAAALAIGLDDMTKTDVLRLSPALMPSVDAIMKALNLAFYGPKGAPREDAPANPIRKIARRLAMRLMTLSEKQVGPE